MLKRLFLSEGLGHFPIMSLNFYLELPDLNVNSGHPQITLSSNYCSIFVKLLNFSFTLLYFRLCMVVRFIYFIFLIPLLYISLDP